MKALIYISLAGLFITNLYAQQVPLSTLYTTNRFQINSAYAGFNPCTEGYISHRSQWVGVGGAPQTSFLSLHTNLGKSLGIGTNISLDKTDLITNFTGDLALSYGFHLGREHHIRLGVSGGMFQVNTSTRGAIVEDQTDEIVMSGNQRKTAFKNEFSIYYGFKKLEIGFSVPQIIETETSNQFGSNPGGFGLARHFVTYAGYKFDLTEKLELEPSVVYKTQDGSTNQFDINAQVTYNKMVYVGMGYRTSAGVLARVGMNIKDLFVVSYAYEFPGANIGSYSKGSHEIMIGIKLCRERDDEVVELVKADEQVVETAKTETKADEIVESEVVEVATVEEGIKEEVEGKVEVEAKAEKQVVTKTVLEEVAEEVAVQSKEDVPEQRQEKVLEQTKKEIPEQIIEQVQEQTPATNSELNLSPNEIAVTVMFDFNSSNLPISYNQTLNELANEMAKDKSIKLIISGYSCDMGTEEVQYGIARIRGQHVKNYLIKQGVSADRMVVKSRGDSNQIVPNTSIENRKQNRRVEVVIVQ